ncbi:MAG: hypothetical protein JRJ47_05315 [Deltaproteobacteria bacterium]|nr:hypothetical protein [Deltaproteobacteria bacterium]
MRKSYYLATGLIFLSVWLQACATTVDPLCSHKALYQAITFNDLTGAPVRIAVGPSHRGDHAQAQAQVDGKWEWLEGDDFGVVTGYMDRVRGFEPNQYVSVESFLNYMGYGVTKTVNLAQRKDLDFPATMGDYSSSRSIYRSPF